MSNISTRRIFGKLRLLPSGDFKLSASQMKSIARAVLPVIGLLLLLFTLVGGMGTGKSTVGFGLNILRVEMFDIS